MKVREIMHRGADAVTPETRLTSVAKTMRDQDIGAVPITQDGKILGILTDRDIVIRGLSQSGNLNELTAHDVMTRGIISCAADEEVEYAIHLMEQHRIRRMPVVDINHHLVGMLSLGDISHATGRELSGELITAVSTHHV